MAGLPDAPGRHREGRQHRCRQIAPALETVEIDSIKGKVAMRACDHQAVQQGFMVKVVKQKEGSKDPIPELIATFPPIRPRPPVAR